MTNSDKIVKLQINKLLFLTNKANEIIDAANESVAVYGLAKITMTNIDGWLEMSKASLYYYIKAKIIYYVLRKSELSSLPERSQK